MDKKYRYADFIQNKKIFQYLFSQQIKEIHLLYKTGIKRRHYFVVVFQKYKLVIIGVLFVICLSNTQSPLLLK